MVLMYSDVGGVCREVGDVIQFTAKTSGRELKKRDVTLVDRSGSAVCVTLIETQNCPPNY